MNDNIKEFFNRIADSWTNDNSIEFIKSLLDKVGIKEQDDVLDVGCGKGIITPILYEYSHKCVDGIDLSDRMISYTKNSEKNVFHCGDFLTYDFGKQYDCIVIFNAYPHILNKEALASKAYSVLKENGKLVIMHDLSRKELNTHHEQCAMGISKKLNSPDEEYAFFSDKFNKVLTIDDDKSYMLLMKRK